MGVCLGLSLEVWGGLAVCWYKKLSCSKLREERGTEVRAKTGLGVRAEILRYAQNDREGATESWVKIGLKSPHCPEKSWYNRISTNAIGFV